MQLPSAYFVRSIFIDARVSVRNKLDAIQVQKVVSNGILCPLEIFYSTKKSMSFDFKRISIIN